MSTCCLYGLIMHDHHRALHIYFRVKFIMLRPIGASGSEGGRHTLSLKTPGSTPMRMV